MWIGGKNVENDEKGESNPPRGKSYLSPPQKEDRNTIERDRKQRILKYLQMRKEFRENDEEEIIRQELMRNREGEMNGE